MHRRYYSPSHFVALSLPIPGTKKRRLRLVYPDLRSIYASTALKYGRKVASLLFLLAFLLLALVGFALYKIFGTPSTLIFEHEDLRRIWEWEIASGHYPSRRPIPEQLRFAMPPSNPAIPLQYSTSPGRPGSYANHTKGTGAGRTYFINRSPPAGLAYPPRPVPGTAADMDVVMEHCDFAKNKYVRDCLEVLRIGAGLNAANKIRKRVPGSWRYIYKEEAGSSAESGHGTHADLGTVPQHIYEERENPSMLDLSPPRPHRPSGSLTTPCDPDYPRVFHMFWAGEFTDKPYTALLSFLYTQNTGLHLRVPAEGVCRPQFWMWINPGPAASVHNPRAVHDMFEGLKKNPWSSPFLHHRFKDVVVFKLWNTTEQLDGIPELKNEWRNRELFNTGGRVISVPKKALAGSSNEEEKARADSMLNRAGSKSSSTYDRLSVILSDMARFILCHRFGGTYLDADSLFLRDWEELWGWKGAFAYRWSRLARYNTAVLHLNKGSALGTFLFRTALKNGLDFHPMTITRYTKDAHLEELLLRLPDALFDSAWLNTERYQRDRPPQPYFTDFKDLFETPAIQGAAPQALGFDGFFKGAFSYHFHNFWWKPFDPERNWPDLGPRFIAGERLVHTPSPANATVVLEMDEDEVDFEEKRDLHWAAVLKRTFEAYIRGERPNMYGEWLQW